MLLSPYLSWKLIHTDEFKVCPQSSILNGELERRGWGEKGGSIHQYGQAFTGGWTMNAYNIQ